MYESFYGLKEKPFSMLPDPGFLYLSKKHQMALTLLEYGLLNQVGFCVVSGETGSGKTTLLRKLLESIADDVTVGMITNTHKGFGELLDWVLSAYGIHAQGMSTVDMHQRFMDFLVEQYAANKTTLLIVDEAQNMTAEKLEELRMLSNVNSDKDQVLQVILAGQPDLKETLQLPELRQFAQRIGIDHHLASLNQEETYGYIQHRLSIAGATKEIFTEEACDQIYEYSGGIPRLINLLCDTVMVYGFADQQEVINGALVDEMVQERMKDSIVPLANKTPSKKKNKAKPGPKKVWQAENIIPAEPTKSNEKDSDDNIVVNALAAIEGASAGEQSSNNETLDSGKTKAVKAGDNVYKEAVESIEQMVSESVAFDSSVRDADDDKAIGHVEGDIRRRSPNTIEVVQPEEITETKSWKWVAAIVVAIVVSVLVFMIGTSGTDESVGNTIASKVNSGNGSETVEERTVVQEVPEKIKRQLEEAEKFRKELSRRQEEDRARMQVLEEKAAILQRERDEALAKANTEKTQRAREAALAKQAAQGAKEAQKAAQKAIADAMAAERKAQLIEKLRAEEAARLEQEFIEKQAKLEALKEVEAKPEPVVEVKKKEQSFNTDPCASSTARFLSTCR